MNIDGMHQIGEVADAVGLSLRTIRYYEDVDLVQPSGRSVGGFRLYNDEDVERLRLVKQLKPLGFSLEDLQQILIALDGIEQGGSRAAEDPHRQVLGAFVDQAELQCGRLRDQLAAAEALTRTLRQEAGTREPGLGRAR